MRSVVQEMSNRVEPFIFRIFNDKKHSKRNFSPFNLYKIVIYLVNYLPFKLIVATAWVANLNVDLFIRGHKKRLHPYRMEPQILDLLNNFGISAIAVRKSC